MDKKTCKDIGYRNNYFSIKNYDENKKIGAYARWFTVNPNDRSLVLYPVDCHGYLDLQQYRLTIPTPLDNDDNFFISQKIFKKISLLMMLMSKKIIV